MSGRWRRLPLAAALLLAAAACHRAQPQATPASGEGAATTEASYLAPPRVVTAAPAPDGATLVSGVAPARSKVGLTSPEGWRASVAADGRGLWRARLPAAATPHLYALSAEARGRSVHADGALLTAPGALAPLVVVRAGYAAEPVTAAGGSEVVAVDYDPGGFVAVAGSAPPHAHLVLGLDGTQAAVGQASADGRFALLATGRRLAPGPHLIQLRAPDRAIGRGVRLEPAAPLTTPYQTWRTAEGWRVEWALNGGGVQTTLILTP